MMKAISATVVPPRSMRRGWACQRCNCPLFPSASSALGIDDEDDYVNLPSAAHSASEGEAGAGHEKTEKSRLVQKAERLNICHTDSVAYPICAECLNTFEEGLSLKVTSTRAMASYASKAYDEFCQRIPEVQGSEGAIQQLEGEISGLRLRLQELTAEEDALETEAANMEDELYKLQSENCLEADEFDLINSELEVEEFEFLDEAERLYNSVVGLTGEVEVRSYGFESLFNISFHISRTVMKKKGFIYGGRPHTWEGDMYCVEMGSINGLRCGWLNGEPVSWEELNAAFGALALCLHSIATTFSVQTEPFTIVPAGSTSLVMEGQITRPLHIDYTSDPVFENTNSGLRAFLACFERVSRHLKKPSAVDLESVTIANVPFKFAVAQPHEPFDFTVACSLLLKALQGLIRCCVIKEEKELGDSMYE